MERKVFAFLGDFYHQREPLELAVQTAVRGVGDVEIAFQLPTSESMNHALDQNPMMIILGAENRINPEDEIVRNWLTDELDNRLEAYVAAGGSLLVLHSGLASYPPDSKYRKMIKGEFLSHPPEHCQVRYYSEDDGVPLNGNASYDYVVIDEFYVVDVDTEDTNVFLYSECEEHGTGLAGWHHTYGEGKVMCLVPTHNKEGFEHAETLRLYHKTIEWGLC